MTMHEAALKFGREEVNETMKKGLESNRIEKSKYIKYKYKFKLMIK